MCLHCYNKTQCTSLGCVLRSTVKSEACKWGSGSLEIAKLIFEKQNDEVKHIIRGLRKEDSKARRGYGLFAAYDNAVPGESLDSRISIEKAFSRNVKRLGRELPETLSKHDLNFAHIPDLSDLKDKNLTELHMKQLKVYETIANDLNRLKLARKERTAEVVRRSAQEAERNELRKQLKEKVLAKSNTLAKSVKSTAEKRSERKERALAQKQREQEARDEIKLNQAKLQKVNQ